MKLSIQAGSTSQSVNVFVRDSSSTTGGGLTGLVYNAASLTAYYALPRAAAVSITLATLAAVTSGFSSGGFKEIDATNMPGWYRLDIPDAALATGRFVSIHLKGAANMAPLPIEIELTGWNNQDAVRGGMTALPNANAGANGGVPLGDASGRVDIGKLLGTAWLTPGTAGTPDVNVKLWNGLTTVALPLAPTTAGRTLDVSAGGEAGIDLANVGSPTTTLNLSGTTIATTQKVDVETIKTQAVTAAAGVTFPASVASPTNITAGTITTVTNLTNAPTAGDFTSTMKTSIGTAVAASAVASVTGNVGGNVTGSVGSVATGGITAGSIAADAIGASELAADAVAEIAAGVRTELTTELGRLDAAVSTRLASASYTTPPTVGAIADQVWDEALSGHATGGSAGAALSAAGSAGDPWSTPLPGAYGAGTAGQIVGDYLDVAVSSVGGGSAPTASAIADEVQTRTIAAVTLVNGLAANTVTASALATDAVTEIQSGLATASALSTVASNVSAILADTAEIGAAGAGLTAVPWNASWDAEVQSEVTDALNAYDPPTNAEMVARTLVTADYATATALATVDTVVDGIATDVALLPTADDVWDEAVDGSVTARQSMRLANSALAGKASGMETTAVAFRDLADTKDRITATVTADGNRTAVTTDLT